MTIPRSLERWLRLPSGFALLLGLGAVSAAGAQGDTPEVLSHRAVPPVSHDRITFGDVLIRSEGGKLFLSEGGRDFEELPVKDTAEARHLQQLLKHYGAASGLTVRINPTLVADSGCGFMWPLPEKTDTSQNANTAQKTTPPSKTDGSSNSGGPNRK